MGKGKFTPGGRNPAPEDLEPTDNLPDLTGSEELPLPDETAQEILPPASEYEAPESLPVSEDLPAEESVFPEETFASSGELEDEEAGDETPGTCPIPHRRGIRTGSLIFYTLYICFILLFSAGIWLLNSRLEQWLTDYQLSQPTDKRDQVYHDLFLARDWEAVYEAAGLEDTPYEGSDSFVSFMTQWVGDRELTLVETSAGLSGNRMYFVKLEQESIAFFQLQPEEDPVTGLCRWELWDLDVFFQREESIAVQIQEGQTACVNGIPLDPGHIVRVDSLLADRYLPVGVYPHRSYTLQVSGFLLEPEVTVLDHNGEEVPVTYDPELDLYQTAAPAFSETISEHQQKAAADTVGIYSQYLLGEAEADALTQCCDRTTDVIDFLLKTAPFDLKTAAFTYLGEEISGFRQYGEDLFSVRIRLNFESTPLSAGDENEDEPLPEPEKMSLEHTLFFLYEDGCWVCIGATEESEPESAAAVLVLYVMDGTVVSDNLLDTGLRELVVPIVSAPEGRVFAGWYREQTDDHGNTTLVPVFRPDETGLVVLPDDLTLEPMTLYALFEDVSTDMEVTD